MVLVGELAVRLFFFGWHDAPRQLLVPSTSSVLVYELRPETRVTTAYLNPKQRDWEYTVSINAHGFRGALVELEPTNPRVIVIGDSYTFGYGVDDGETFSAVLERNLGTNVEVLNWGVPGYNLEQSIELLALRGKAYRPDVVVLSQHPNDFDPSPMETAREVRYVLRSHLYAVFRHIRFLYGSDAQAQLDRSRGARVERGFRAFDRFVELAREWGFRPVLFRAGCRGGYDVAAMDRLFAHSHAAGVQTVETSARSCRQLRENLIPDDGHPTVSGHELIANELLPHVRRELALGRESRE